MIKRTVSAAAANEIGRMTTFAFLYSIASGQTEVHRVDCSRATTRGKVGFRVKASTPDAATERMRSDSRFILDGLPEPRACACTSGAR